MQAFGGLSGKQLFYKCFLQRTGRGGADEEDDEDEAAARAFPTSMAR